MAEARYPEDKLYRFHWRSAETKPQDGYGRDVADAFSRLGYGGGAHRALDYFEEVTPSTGEPTPADGSQVEPPMADSGMPSPLTSI